MGHGSGKPNKHPRHTKVANYPDEYGITWGEWQELEDRSLYRQGWDAAGKFVSGRPWLCLLKQPLSLSFLAGQVYEDTQPAPVDSRVPRTTQPVEQLTAQFSNVSVNSGGSYQDYAPAASQVQPQQGMIRSSSVSRPAGNLASLSGAQDIPNLVRVTMNTLPTGNQVQPRPRATLT
jgi:hypothetical protein